MCECRLYENRNPFRELKTGVQRIFMYCASPNSVSASMLKSLILIFLSLIITIVSFGQFYFKNDSTDSRIQSGAMDEINKKFSLQKDNDFELRLFIFPKWSDKNEGLSIFILSFKNEKWRARLFRNAWSEKNSQEIWILRRCLQDSPIKNGWQAQFYKTFEIAFEHVPEHEERRNEIWIWY